MCFGDSNTFGYNPSAKFGERYDLCWTDILAEKTGWNVINQGVNGREVPDDPIQLEKDIDLILVMLGTNDLLQLDTPEATAQRLEVFLSAVSPEKVILIAPPSMVWGDWVQDQELIDDANMLGIRYEALAGRLGIRYGRVDSLPPMAYDGVHFTEEGHRAFAQALYEMLHKGE
jgi:lysophospholipase L1-like esterase